MEKYGVKIVLATLSTNLTTGELYILSVDKDECVLPFSYLDNNFNIQFILNNLIKKYINLDVSWISTQLVSCIESSPEEIIIVYKSIIPYDTNLTNAYWTPIFKVNNNPLILYIINNIT
jgi:hypothetical protein